MSTSEKDLPQTTTDRWKSTPGPTPDRYKHEYLTDPKVLTDLLYRTEELTDEAFEDLVNDIGYRAALLVLRTKALGADIRALDLYLKLCREDRENRRKRDTPVERNVHASSFSQAARVSPTTPIVESNDEE